MRVLTEYRISAKKETFIEKYIDSFIAGNIKNLVIKEEWIVLERLKEQRGVYVAELEELRKTDLEAKKRARLEERKAEIFQEVEDEFNKELAAAELKISHYDFVIADEEAKAEAELLQENEIENNEIVEE